MLSKPSDMLIQNNNVPVKARIGYTALNPLNHVIPLMHMGFNLNSLKKCLINDHIITYDTDS